MWTGQQRALPCLLVSGTQKNCEPWGGGERTYQIKTVFKCHKYRNRESSRGVPPQSFQGNKAKRSGSLWVKQKGNYTEKVKPEDN